MSGRPVAWDVSAKAAFGDAQRLIRYFGRYMRLVAISDRRLLAVDEEEATLATKDGDEVSLAPLTFLARLLLLRNGPSPPAGRAAPCHAWGGGS